MGKQNNSSFDFIKAHAVQFSEYMSKYDFHTSEQIVLALLKLA